VLNTRGRMRLQVRPLDGGYESLMLPYTWSAEGAAKALPRIQQIFKRYVEGQTTLALAGRTANTASSKQSINFDELIANFRRERPQANERTWRVKYLPVLTCAAAVMGGNSRPTDGHALCALALDRWEHGGRQRQIMRQNLHAFLRFAVERGELKSVYLPPATTPELLRPKRIGYPLTDAQVLRLLQGIPDNETGHRWRFAIQLLAVYGLRPEELRYLVIKEGVEGPELWSIYRKSKGGRQGAKTEPRRLLPLLVRDIDKNPLEWDLQSRVWVSEAMPPLGRDGKAGEAIGTFLRRLQAWKELKAEAKSQGEVLTPYSFRHRYSQRAHAAGLAPKLIADAMGHTLEVHLQAYARFNSGGLAAAFAAINQT